MYKIDSGLLGNHKKPNSVNPLLVWVDSATLLPVSFPVKPSTRVILPPFLPGCRLKHINVAAGILVSVFLSLAVLLLLTTFPTNRTSMYVMELLIQNGVSEQNSIILRKDTQAPLRGSSKL